LVVAVILFGGLLVCRRRYWKPIIMAGASFIVIWLLFGAVVNFCLKPSGHTQTGMLSVPNTQIAATFSDNRSVISADDSQYFLSYLSLDYWQSYAPRNADLINGLLSQSENVSNFSLIEYLSHWRSLCADNLKICAKAFIELEGPFFDPRRENQYCLIDRTCSNHAYANLFDIIARRFSIYPYLLILLMVIAIRKKLWHVLVPSLALLGYIAAFCLVAPVVYLRYAFPIGWVILPLIVLTISALTWRKK
jgi:hypothetical protein